MVPGSKAVVIGGGMAGLLAAQALSGTFADVTIVERDHIGQSLGHRSGVPQDRHVHTLWAAGMAAIETLVPGVEKELQAVGGVKAVAAMQATALAELCRRRIRGPGDAARMSGPAQRTMARIAARAWLVSASEDRRYPVTGGASPAIKLLHRYMDRVMLATTVDAHVAHTFLRVLNMLDRPFTLQRPDVMIRVLRGSRRAQRRGETSSSRA